MRRRFTHFAGRDRIRSRSLFVIASLGAWKRWIGDVSEGAGIYIPSVVRDATGTRETAEALCS